MQTCKHIVVFTHRCKQFCVSKCDLHVDVNKMIIGFTDTFKRAGKIKDKHHTSFKFTPCSCRNIITREKCFDIWLFFPNWANYR